jgi:UDP-N-acetylglucosamine diphosphorylase / glucose-1-phosphate thymidylyltransferase / UDP-N-acetylgalactosamine diphosphorylase / glucosamine-1-phosphate N-acetyltransferase / galactosamine-1-phosphate N-acetyltransferase
MSGAVPATDAVILARGLGTRMRRDSGTVLDAEQARAADGGAKAMIPFARPFIDYVLSALADGGITRVVLVVGPPSESTDMRDYFERTRAGRRVRVEFAVQAEPRGTADALLAARFVVQGASFLSLNADNYYPADAFARLASLGSSGLIGFDADALVRDGNIEPERVLRYALLDVDDDGWLRAIREKPAADDPLALRAHRLVSMNVWSFTPRIFDACERVRPSSRGELELVDAVTIAMRDLGERFRVLPMQAPVLDLSQRTDVAVVGARLAAVTPAP